MFANMIVIGEISVVVVRKSVFGNVTVTRELSVLWNCIVLRQYLCSNTRLRQVEPITWRKGLNSHVCFNNGV